MKIILASKSGVRKKILDDHGVDSEVVVSNVDEDEIKISLLSEGADPLSISKNLASAQIPDDIEDTCSTLSCPSIAYAFASRISTLGIPATKSFIFSLVFEYG